ncbi:MAG: N-acetylmuramoyl-L-alanine amidase [Alphaproteobacteria bacterium]|nr:N-acetylmuramoyl-L-alanine amidase [Alphaproteobacteria bacterium]
MIRSIAALHLPGSLRAVAAALALALAFASVLAGSPARAEPVAWISDVRLGQHKDHTRIVLRVDRKVDFEHFTLEAPYRIVIDFPEVGWRVDPGAGSHALGLVKGYRYGSYKPGTSRMVIDLAGPAMVANRFLLPPEGAVGEYRLVLDLAPTDAAAYTASAGWKGPAEPVEPAPEIRSTKSQRARTTLPVVVVDAGHGGLDPGAIGVSGTKEKEIVLKVAQSLAENLRKTGRYKVIMTRDEDIFLSLKARVAIARKNRADLFISIHADSAPAANARGASVYTLSERASDREAEALARSENQSDIIAGIDLAKEPDIVTSILIDLAQRDTNNLSAQFAQILIPELHTVGSLTLRTHRFAGFQVLKSIDVPSVLIELGYLTNADDESAMRGSRWRRNMAEAIARAVDGYFAADPGKNIREQASSGRQ